MLILLLLMALALPPDAGRTPAWRGLNRRVIAAVKVVDPMITRSARTSWWRGRRSGPDRHEHLGDRTLHNCC